MFLSPLCAKIYHFVQLLIFTDVVRKAVLGMMAMKRMTTLASHLTPEQRALERDIFKYKEESEKVPFSFSAGVQIYLLTCHLFSTGVDGEHCRPAPSQPSAP